MIEMNIGTPNGKNNEVSKSDTQISMEIITYTCHLYLHLYSRIFMEVPKNDINVYPNHDPSHWGHIFVVYKHKHVHGGVPSGNLTFFLWKITFFGNILFQWPFSMVMLVITRGFLP